MLDFSHEEPTATGNDLVHEDEEPTPMQVRLAPNGDWHRLTVDIATTRALYAESRNGGERTACGKSISGVYTTRDESYDGTLCPSCFTAYEMSLAVARIEAKREYERLENLKWGRTRSQRIRERKEMYENNDKRMREINTERMRRLNADGTQSDEPASVETVPDPEEKP